MSVSRSRAGLVRATAIGRRCTQQVSCTRSTVFRTYQSSSYSAPSPFNTAETAILSSALRYVPEHGFSDKSLARGAPDAGYREASTNLFPKGPFALVNYHLVTQRLGLRGNVQFRDDKLSAGAKVRALILGRLRGNESVIHRWQEALAIMALPSNASTSLGELARLADEILYLAGDISVDFSWYTKRATISAIYSSTELYMTSDNSPEFVETEQFLDRRLEESRAMGIAVAAIGEWTKFTAQATMNVARSKGVSI